MNPPTTRRGLVTQPFSPADEGVIAPVLTVERALAVSYRHVLDSGALGHHARNVVRSSYEHELAHVRAFGGRVASGPAAVAAAAKVLSAPALASVHSEADCVRLLLAAEQAALRAYFKAMSQFSSTRLLQLAAEIMASEAQHVTLLTELLYPGDIDKAVPVPFVQGTS